MMVVISSLLSLGVALLAGTSAAAPQYSPAGPYSPAEPYAPADPYAPDETSPAETSSAEVNVDFENPAYSVGATYNGTTQLMDWDVAGGANMDGQSATISSDAASSGSRSLRIRYPANDRQVQQALWQLKGAKTYYLSYRLMFAADFSFNGLDGAEGGRDGGKLPGLAGSQNGAPDQICSGCETCPPGTGFTARLMWRTDGMGQLYLYDVSKTDRCGDQFNFEGKQFQKGVWQTVTQRVTLNDDGQSNGQIQVYLDDEMVVDLQDRYMVAAGEDIDLVHFATFFGGKGPEWYPTTEQTAFFDDFIVSEHASDVDLCDDYY